MVSFDSLLVARGSDREQEGVGVWLLSEDFGMMV
jgi:hypothetical protein